MLCRALTTREVRFEVEGGAALTQWVHGYECGERVTAPDADACNDHLVRELPSWV